MSEAKGDSRVTEVQEWLNETYGAQSWFTKLTVDGMTGAGTCKALCKALQYEIGVKNVDGVIGAGTLAVCPTIGATVTNTNLIKIIQCGFYCKGYECGGITGHYGVEVEIAAQKFKMDAGFDVGNGELQPIFIRALLNTDAFVLVKNGKDYVREAQQYLNNTYIVKLSNWALIPCNGIPDRNMMKAIIAGLQYEEANHSTSGVDGIYGKNTLSKAPTLSSGTAKTAYVKIVQMCLMCMMETNAGMDGAFGSALKKQIEEFQKFYCLSGVTSGTVDRITWASLLSSKGETSRAAKACDTSTVLNYAKAKSLYDAGYRYVGRYLSGTVGGKRSKAMTAEEIADIFKAGLRIFAIFQEGTPSMSRYTLESGVSEAQKALSAARQLGIPEDAIIYFAIDYDVMESGINAVKQYFAGIRRVFAKAGYYYHAGIYGARNVCSKVCNSGLAESSYVSDMSTGFSGNLGYKIPENWAFDQFHEYQFPSTDGTFGLDKVGYSGRYNGFVSVTKANEMMPDVSDDYRRQKTVKLFKALGLPLRAGFKMATKYKYYQPYLEVTYSVYEKAELLPDEGVKATVTVENGKMQTDVSNTMETIFGKLDIKYTTDLGITSAFTIELLSKEIENGSIGIDFKLNAVGELILILKCKAILREDALTRYTMGYEIELKYLPKDDSAPQEEYEYTELYNWMMENQGQVATAGVVLLLGCWVLAELVSGGTVNVMIPVFVTTLPKVVENLG